jgi:F0F1-type ATP synthase assembly protein I
LGLDTWLNTKPLFILVGTFVGGGLGFVSIWREMKADPANRPTWKGGRLPGTSRRDDEDDGDGRSR